MSVLLTLAVALLTAITACLGAGVVAAVCVSWYHITSREGASGYFVVAMAFLGLVGGAVIGVVCARIVAARPSPTFLGALGASLGTTLALLLLITGFAWLGADFPPKIDGKELVVEFEIRLPEGARPPKPEEVSGLAWTVTITAAHGSRRQRMAQVDAEKAKEVDGRWVVPATVYLHTSDPGKSAGIVLGDDHVSQFFDLPIGSRPTRADMSWSRWLTDAHFGNLTPVPAKDAVALRYRIQFYVEPPPPPPAPSQEEVEAKAKAERDAAFAALTPESPLDAWLSFTRYGEPEERRAAAANAIAARPDVVPELSKVIRSENHDIADVALRAILLMKDPPVGLAPAVEDVGRQIAADIRVVNATTAEEDPSYQKAADAEVRFMGWNSAARALHGRPGVDLRPVMKEILELSKVRSESLTMQEVARVAGHYSKEWESAPAKP